MGGEVGVDAAGGHGLGYSRKGRALCAYPPQAPPIQGGELVKAAVTCRGSSGTGLVISLDIGLRLWNKARTRFGGAGTGLNEGTGSGRGGEACLVEEVEAGEGKGGPSTGSGQTGEGDPAEERLCPGRNRQIQVTRTGGRKLFDDERKAVFLEWFAATCNASWAAERAGVDYRTVWKHRMNDPVFAEGFDRCEEQAVARLRAKRLETKRRPLEFDSDGEADAPEMDDIDPILAGTLLREHGGAAGGVRPRKVGRTPHVASNVEVRAALVKRLAAFGVRVFGDPVGLRSSSTPPEASADGGEGEGEGEGS